MALLVAGMLTLGWNAARLPLDHPAKPDLIAWHQVLGLIVLACWGLRVWQRRRHGRPDWPEPLPAWRARLAIWNQRLLYALILAMPLVGIGISLLDPFIWPRGPNPPADGAAPADWAQRLHLLHYTGAWLLVLAVLMHVAGALGHLLGRNGRRWWRRIW